MFYHASMHDTAKQCLTNQKVGFFASHSCDHVGRRRSRFEAHSWIRVLRRGKNLLCLALSSELADRCRLRLASV
ncbi:hypothetical protein T4A_10955 [Trichinella pseudospiralis]|uniref:Uncharacterized protein n=1 Tax=Trichinella pseudospiralis TaxID=6337 RepID=A0A0V1ERV2_TRIPS|nr:hypothetical protein T4A_10955 [Trichinella pseudospiralis]